MLQVEHAPIPENFTYHLALNLNPGTLRHVVYSPAHIKTSVHNGRTVLHLAERSLVRHEGADHSDVWLEPGEYVVSVIQEMDLNTGNFVPVFD